VLEAVGVLVPRRNHRRRQALDVTVLVAADRPLVVGGDDPAADMPVGAAFGADHQHQPEVRQLVVGQADGSEVVVDVLEPIRVDRRPDPVAERRRPDERPRGRAPDVEREVGDSSAATRKLEAGEAGMAGGSAGGPVDRQPSAPASGSQAKSSSTPARSIRRTVDGRKSRRASNSVVLPAPWASPATISGRRASSSSQASPASSASSTPAVDQLDDRAPGRRDGAAEPGQAVVVHRLDDDRP
jgi:hypothetical protein